ncbi:RAMP superfamily CRISPR-associated protein [Laspinema olomoucense]|uniref:RAMP superfamily CRISPR-associated protein n=1 Tax=Laspinema olomoucense TaxID=3231600 RepID=UPI0021BAD56C|nr:RAMP superfamily CRISPR-associated protein [Laspinema sp. D3d]MCT7971769.1 RAMP superfamily protein [Laspinema sp. D3d]
MTIPNADRHIPLMFQAQTEGRSQLQYIKKTDKQESQRWADQWTERIYPTAPQFGEGVETRTYTISWRFVTNGGQDEGIIRPAIGAYGWPIYPGSSMKGVFRHACKQIASDRIPLYCGDAEQPGILRFHGGYPISDEWKKNLVDLVHPQQQWQVEVNVTTKKPNGESGYTLISLDRPTLQFGISTTDTQQTNWDEVWKIWETALGYGIGCRTSSGYGMPENRIEGETKYPIKVQGTRLCQFYLKGQGQCPQLVDKTSEFRPNLFRGALRSHALRIFGGLTDAQTARNLVEMLFGGVQGHGTVGLLTLAWKPTSVNIKTFTVGYDEPTYDVAGQLQWILTRSLPESKQNLLQKLMRMLMRFAMLFSGFGKSWRRADHRLFYPEYYKNNGRKPLIGCHWEWEKFSLINDNTVGRLQSVNPFINAVQKTALDWIESLGITPTPDIPADWREAWHPQNVEVWGRVSQGREDCKAVQWLHQPYQKFDRYTEQKTQTIKQTSVTGSINQIGRLWHRMYPVVRVVKTPLEDGQEKKEAIVTKEFWELLTIFPDNSPDCTNFIKFLHQEAGLKSQRDSFQKLWPK